MGDRKSLRFENHQLNGAESMVDDGVADNTSEAIRMTVNSGLAEYGYISGERTETESTGAWRAILQELARLFAYSGLAYGTVAATFRVPALLWWVLLLLAGSLCCIAMSQYADRYGFGLGRRLRDLITPSEA